ncbi:choice-of-anchor L domain-containing protein [Flavobacterium sp.]|uniref:T9SS type B sorting domain-containing protein n=1 Tax=Flavobacterium sp. TaxID=239 RepID=UPI003751C007
MKKIFLLIASLFSIVAFSQAITVNTSTYTADELVRTVLTNNSPCLSIDNVSSRTGTNFGSTNGIGYFTNTNPAFPLQNGVILTTGNVINAPGPNNTILSDGTLAWLGDANLETALAAAGVTIVSKNATVLEFDFKPFSPNFNFQFLFASEEYGNYQCFSPDAFAFLLTNTTTGVTQNLAVIPSTTIPISVQTIRNSIYNPICNSANPSYFGLFNDGTAAAASATNYNGQTVVMNASSTNLSITDTYHIKLVIADGNNDSQYDSAVFLGGGSFDFGQDVLGPDITIASGTAPCNNNNINQPYTISSGLDPNLFDFVWKDVNGIPIPGETGPNLIVNQPGTYLLTYYVQSTSCEVATNNINIEYQTAITTPDPINLYKCNNGSANYTFNLATNTPIVNPAATYQISYHEFQAQADAGLIPLPTNYTVPVGSLPKTVWVRIQNPTTDCYYSKSFILDLTPAPITNSPGNIPECETIAGSGLADFNLGTAAQINTILGGQSSSIYSVSYHLTPGDAASGANPINTSIAFNSGNTTIYVRVYVTTDPNCSSAISFNLIVNPKPVVEDKPDQYVCVSYFLPVLTPALGNYYSGPNGTGTLYPVGYEVTIDQLIYIYYQNPTTGCSGQTDFQVTIVEQQDLTPGNVTACDSYSLPAYPYPGTRYFANAGGPIAGNTELFPPPTGTPITALGVTTIHVYYQSPTDPTCIIFTSFDVTINKTPTITGTYPNLFDCTSINTLQPITVDIGTANYYTLDIPTGIYTPVVLPIITDTTVYMYAENNGCRTPITSFFVVIGTGSFLDNIDSCDPYNLIAPTVGEYRTQANGGGTIIAPGLISSTTTLYHYVAGATCTYNYSFTIRILKPTLTAPTAVTRCDSFTLPVNPESASYYTLSGGPATASNVQLFPNDVITTTSTIYLYKESTTALVPVCYNEQPWTITINQKPVLAPVAPKYIVCYDFILTNQPPVGIYYHSPGGVNPITLPYTILQTNTPSNLETIYIYAENTNDPTCNSETSFVVDFDGVAIPDNLKGDRYACDSYTLPTLPTNFYYYTATGGPQGTGTIINPLTVYNTSTSIPPSPIYIYTETNVRQICSDETSFNIIIYDTPVLDATLPMAFNYCDTFTLQPLTVGKYYNQSITNLVGRVEILAGTIYSGLVNTPTGAILPPASVFVYAESGTSTTKTCYIEREIPISLFNVTQLPDVPATCDSYQLKPSDLKPGENYYLNNDGTGLLASNATISASGITTIYIRGVAPFVPTNTPPPTCFDQTSFTVTIVKRPIAYPVSMLEKCDTFGLNDGIFEFNLNDIDIRNQILNGQIPDAEFTLTFYTSLAGADGSNPLATPIPTSILTAYPNDNPFTDSVWIRVQNNTITNSCFAVTELKLKVNLLPNPQLDREYFICKDHETGTLLNFATLNTGLTNANYTYAWTLNGAPYPDTINPASSSSITTNQIGTYTVTVRDTSTILNCPKTITTKVTLYEPYITFDYSDAFENPTYITVNVLGAGSGNYEYQLDNGSYQSSNIFYNVTAGEHTISVRDKDGHCSPAPVKAIVINYPKFFTPNGDGYHETWNIPNLKNTNPNAPIFIFDRFGKLIKQITPTSDGWNGTYNGQPLPATDYWFTVDYTEKGASKIFKSHFALKR